MMRHLPGVLVLAVASVMHTSGASQNPASKLNWYRGNLHTHTINSDGDSSPSDVLAICTAQR